MTATCLCHGKLYLHERLSPLFPECCGSDAYEGPDEMDLARWAQEEKDWEEEHKGEQ